MNVNDMLKNKKILSCFLIFVIIYLSLSTFKMPIILIVSLLLTYYICFQSTISLSIINKVSSML